MGRSCLGFQYCVPPPRVDQMTWVNQGTATAQNIQGPVGTGNALVMNIPASNFFTVARTDFHTPDQFGFYGNVINAGVPWVRNTIVSWNPRKL